MGNESLDWDLEIDAKRGWFDIDLKSIWHFRDLIFLLAKRDLVSNNKQSLLGQVWIVVNPLFTCFMYMFIFGKVAKIPTNNIPPLLFYLVGIMFWNFFSSNIFKASNTFISNAGIFGKSYFPRLVVPISGIFVYLVNFGVQFLFLALAGLYYQLFQGLSVEWVWFLALPVLLLPAALLSIGVGLIMSTITIQYRDFNNIFGLLIQLLMYATPVVYPMAALPAEWKTILWFNPMCHVIETVRVGLFQSGSIDVLGLGYTFLVGFFVFGFGILSFNQVEKNFIDRV